MDRFEAASLRTASVGPIAATPPRPRSWLNRIGRLFPRNPVIESVATAVELEVPPEIVWKQILFYEEVPKRPAALLQLFLPRPVRTEGDKTRSGELIQCTYDGGHLVKRIMTVDPPHLVSFDVLEQHLGVEDCIAMTGGSYTILPTASGGSEVVLTTRYHGNLRPRWLWRPFERYLAHQVHRHILEGMRAVLPPAVAVDRPAPSLRA